MSFNSNGGSAVSSQSIYYGSLVTQPTAPTRTGHTFAGWYKESALTNAWNFSSDVVTGNTTLYAKWTEILVSAFTVSPSGGTEASPQRYEIYSDPSSNKNLNFYITSVTPSTALDKTFEAVITYGSDMTVFSPTYTPPVGGMNGYVRIVLTTRYRDPQVYHGQGPSLAYITISSWRRILMNCCNTT